MQLICKNKVTTSSTIAHFGLDVTKMQLKCNIKVTTSSTMLRFNPDVTKVQLDYNIGVIKGSIKPHFRLDIAKLLLSCVVRVTVSSKVLLRCYKKQRKCSKFVLLCCNIAVCSDTIVHISPHALYMQLLCIFIVAKSYLSATRSSIPVAFR